MGNTSESLVTCSVSEHCVWKLRAPVSNVKTEMFQHSRTSFVIYYALSVSSESAVGCRHTSLAPELHKATESGVSNQTQIVCSFPTRSGSQHLMLIKLRGQRNMNVYESQTASVSVSGRCCHCSEDAVLAVSERNLLVFAC